ncbi:MAG TPA: MBOAT family protein [Treponema sp.]|nr:MBOAT family protein [Treponema sp.]
MIFPTFTFACFFLVVFIGFWYVFRRSRDRTIFLIAASYLFYAFWDWRFCFLLFFSTAINYGFGWLIGTRKEHVWRKFYLVLAVLTNVLLLGFFKYYTILATHLNALFSWGSSLSGGQESIFSLPVIAVLLPVGISFFTFKALSYVFDVYLCKISPVKSFPDIMLYISFFPQLASGPIVHASDFLPQIEPAVTAGIEPGSRPISFDRAATLIVSGLIKKMVFANFISTLLVDPIFSNLSIFNTLEVIIAAVGYSAVIYADFSGYSDMAIGIALLLGFETPENFNRPYTSFSVTEFWKRWHITFSSWLRNYLYFAFGGSRFGKKRTLFALIATMIIGGLWHGASIPFLIWGGMQGCVLALERAFNYGTKRSLEPWKAAVQILTTFSFVTLSWVVFRSSNLQALGLWFTSLKNFSIPLSISLPVPLFLIFLTITTQFVPSYIRKRSMKCWITVPIPVKGIFLAAFFVILSIVSMSGIAPFIYFQF